MAADDEPDGGGDGDGGGGDNGDLDNGDLDSLETALVDIANGIPVKPARLSLSSRYGSYTI